MNKVLNIANWTFQIVMIAFHTYFVFYAFYILRFEKEFDYESMTWLGENSIFGEPLDAHVELFSTGLMVIPPAIFAVFLSHPKVRPMFVRGIFLLIWIAVLVLCFLHFSVLSGFVA